MTDKIICKSCGSSEIKKNGFVFGNQRYKCKKCGFQFTKMAPHGKDLETKGIAISLCNMGVSQNQTAKILSVTPTSIARWIKEIPNKLPFTFTSNINTEEMEETTLKSYIKKLYINNKENFIISKNSFKSGFEVDIIIKNLNSLPQTKNKELIVYAFGDSILEGVIYDAQHKKYNILRENFLQLSKDILNVKWFNYARHGSTILDGEKTFLEHINQIKFSDYVFLSFGGNDCNFNWDEISNNPNKIHRPNLSLKLFHEKYVQLIKSAQKKGKTPILLSLPPVHSENFFNNICFGRNEKNILNFLRNDINHIFSWHSMYNVELFKIAQETNVPIIDITTYFLSHIDYSKFLCDDGVHPNDKGHLLISKALEDFYKKYFPDN